MVALFLEFCKSKNIAITGAKTLVAVSGGVDSVVLTYLFHMAGAKFEIAHCNFGLRGEESDADEVFVRLLANKLNIRFHSKKFETEQFAQTKGISIQMAARELRYNWFKQVKEQSGCDQVATAHHKGDTVETVLFNLAKGTGIEGLHGILAKTEHAVRPILFATRNDILTFAREENIQWREDSSNESLKYSRNKIRHAVIPVLEEINPKAQEAVFSSTERISEAEEFLNYHVKKLSKSIIKVEDGHTYIDTKGLHNLPGHRYILFLLIKPFGFSYEQASAITESMNGIPGKVYYSLSNVLNVDRSHVIISPIQDDKKGYVLYDKDDIFSIDEFTLATKTINIENYRIKNNSHVLALDKSLLEFPLKFRTWKKGDVFYPLGMKGKKKLSDFMIDAKIPVNLKNHVWLVVSGDDIAGVLNHRLDDRFKITDKTKTVFEITSY